MPRRIRAYAVLAEEHYDLLTYPVVVNILPPATDTPLESQYYSEILGLVARQDFRLINLWQVDVDLVFRLSLLTLLPFTPILKNGGNEATVKKALNWLRTEESISELEPLLAFFAGFVLESELI